MLQASAPKVPKEETRAASPEPTTAQRSSCSESAGVLCLSYTRGQ